MLWRRPLTTVLLAAAVLGGCGGDRAPQTKEGFISAADGVCQDLFSEFAQASASEPDTPQEVAAANEELADLYERLAARLSDVPLPAAGVARSQAQMFVASVRAALPLLESLRRASARFVRAAEAQDREAATRAGNDVRTTLDAFRAARAESDRRAIRYGLTFCGNLG
ncbi:MAG TPA: hypothetical protein VNT54_04830 [Solirubrobacteraceae bacterium]|nr:hypothetical protein [Solirubrobacteraceae bacterium]